jgi:hypothetical protein
VGPVSTKSGSKTCSFMIMQAGSGPILLEYPGSGEAFQARATILANNQTHSVPTAKLFQAIYEALQEQSKSASPSHNGTGTGDKSETEDVPEDVL